MEYIYTTSKKYIDNYLEQLKEHLSEYGDNTETQLIKKQEKIIEQQKRVCNEKLKYFKQNKKEVNSIDRYTKQLAFYQGNDEIRKEIIELKDSSSPHIAYGRAKLLIKRQIDSFDKMLEFLKSRKPQQTELEPLDLSDTKAVEKIIYLNELGIIDFLRSKPEFASSTNLMATVLSAITEEKAGTLQTSLNRIIKNDIDDKNHPYRTEKTVNKVRQILIDKNIKPKTS